MKKLIYILPILLCVFNTQSKGFGNGFAWGFTSNLLLNEARRYQQPNRPSLYVVHPPKPQPNVYVVPQPAESHVVYYQPQHQEAQPIHVCDKKSKKKIEARQIELEIIKEQNRKKELALREKELDIQILKLKQV